MSKLKTKIKETLLEERNRKLKESFAELEDISDNTFLIERFLVISSNLMEQGYEVDEIFGMDNLGSDLTGKLDSANWKETLGSGAMSAAKEYIIRFVLKEVFGAGEGFSTMAAQVFADYSPLDLLKPFKDESNCNQYMPKLCNSLIEVLVRYIGSGMIGADRNDYSLSFKGIGSTVGGNIFGEIIHESNMGKTMADKFCKIIH